MSTEFTTVSSSSFDPAALAAKLTDKSADGWTVVSIVSTGGDVTAFLSRASTGASSASSTSTVTSGSSESSSQPSPEPVRSYEPTSSYEPTRSYEAAPEPTPEPAGWGSAPDPAPSPEPSPAYSPAVEPTPSYTPAPAAAAPTPSVPAGWYADPAGRFELRYWDGGTWTEHVSRAGQQYTDPPVA